MLAKRSTARSHDRSSTASIDGSPARTHDIPLWNKITRTDIAAVTVLAAACLVAWCSANDKWTPRAWSLPTTYLHDPERGDFFSNAAYLRASEDWSGIPFRWKTVTRLGAPYDANWNDYPTLDEIVLTIQFVLSRFLGLFAGINVSFALAHVLAALALYASARLSGANRLWSFVGGLAFGLSPFLYAQSPHHMQVAYVWPVAFFSLLWRVVAVSPGLAWDTKTFAFASAAAFVIGLHFVYYTNVFCQIVLLGSWILWYRTKNAASFRASLVVIGAAALGFAVNNLDGWTYRLFHEPNAAAFVREYKWLEIYGLKLVDLVIPPITHRLAPLSDFAKSHRAGAPLLDEGASYLGIVGMLAFSWLVYDAIRAALDRRFDEVPIEAWWVLWIVVMFTTGGINAIFGAFGITMFRAACRYAVVILAISLLYAARRLTSLQVQWASRATDGSQSILWGTVAAVLGFLVFVDQVPRAPTVDYARTTALLVDSDRRFVAEMEAALPNNALVFQLPIIEYPESPALGLGAYDHFRPYLYSSNLRFSFGCPKGRKRDAWQQDLSQRLFDFAPQSQMIVQVNRGNVESVVTELKDRGFAAIYINRRGFPDGGKALEEALRDAGETRPLIRSPAGDLDCIPLGNGRKEAPGRKGSD